MEIAVLSGKGGTSKTSITASFASLLPKLVLVDCDVDAANLHIVMRPNTLQESIYVSGHTATIDYSMCTHCGVCVDYCRFEAIFNNNGTITIDEIACDGCKLCSRVCPQQAIHMIQNDKSRWYVSQISHGAMVHARLAPGEENSGKLVQKIREEAKKIADQESAQIILLDGPPGTGCPVISTLTGVDVVVCVTEPSRSAFHDLQRLVELVQQFDIPMYVIINKFNIYTELTETICQWCKQQQIPIIAKIPFDKQLVESMIACTSIVDYAPDSITSIEIKQAIHTILKQHGITY